MDLSSQSCEDEPTDYKFVKWLTKEKVNIKDYIIHLFNMNKLLFMNNNKCLSLFCSWFFTLKFEFSLLQGLATMPVSAFYSPEHSKEFDKYIRFCFVKVNLT